MFQQSVTLSARGVHLLRKLHKQILPFVLRRTKVAVAGELPCKTVVDLLVPLSALQRELYRAFQDRLDLSDDQLEADLTSSQPPMTQETGTEGMDEQTDGLGQAFPSLLAAFPASRRPPGPGPGGRGKGQGGVRVHPFKALQYLNLLCVHPALVTAEEHERYRRTLLEDISCSGKLSMLG